MVLPLGAPAPILNMEGWPGVCGPGDAIAPNDVFAGVLALPPKLKPAGL